jgi:sulfate adenylyltransferase
MLVESSIIAPHGGHLVYRRTPDENRKELVREALGLPRVHLDARTLSDLQMIASGVFSPLEGFMLRKDYESVVEDMRLSSGLAWSMPVTLSVEEYNARSLSDGSLVALVDGSGEPAGTMILR